MKEISNLVTDMQMITDRTFRPIHFKVNDVSRNRDSTFRNSAGRTRARVEMRIEREMFRAVTRHARASGESMARVSRGSFSRILTTTTLSQPGGCFEGHVSEGFAGYEEMG